MTFDTIRPEVFGCLSVAAHHLRAATWAAPERWKKHRDKARKLMARAERLARGSGGGR